MVDTDYWLSEDEFYRQMRRQQEFGDIDWQEFRNECKALKREFKKLKIFVIRQLRNTFGKRK